MSSLELPPELSDADRRRVLSLARGSIVHGLEFGRPLVPDPTQQPATLQAPRACFVTLRQGGELRGCMGCLEADDPLAHAVAHYAFQAAFRDPRFSPLRTSELAGLSIGVSVLTPSVPLDCRDEQELLEELEPGRDGVILQEGRRSATLLPAVWKMAPQPRVFLAHLKRKAGLPADYWSASLKFRRYRAESFAEPAAGLAP